ncbi:MAG: polysaccharide biosynthesis protein [Defluviitaleaceae bacterium]|nr:polysaccharide biosynthesis protein [Defluviitaleaceae bacterium]
MTEGRAKLTLYIVCDILFINLALILSVALWYRGYLPGEIREVQSVPDASWQWLFWMCLAATIINVAVLAGFRLYSQLWRYAGVDELLKIFIATSTTMITLFVLDLIVVGRIAVLPRIIFVSAWFMLFFLSSASRLGERILRRLIVSMGFLLSSKAGFKRVMVIGAGYGGYNLVHSMIHSTKRERMPVLIVDDDPAKNNSHILGIRIVNGVSNIRYLSEAYEIDEITIAMPGADNLELRHILEFCTQTDCRLTIVPPISEVDRHGPDSGLLREVNISDLLYRDEITLDKSNIQAYIEGACILVTGGGGSIGSELCRQLIRYNPSKILIVDIYENDAFDLVQELREKYDTDVIFRVGSIRDRARMDELFAEFKPDVVFHAAAHKHVMTMEDSPAEAVKNNIFGTLNVIRAAVAHNTGRFVLISSDKAVKPTNIYGATKRVAELVMQREAARGGRGNTLISAVRFGNVLGSRGSIIPKFKRQIAEGGPVTVYSKKAERFFMTISEACQLVLQAGGLVDETNNGHIFILDMGKPVNIDDLARKLIRLSGYRPDEDIKIVYTGHLPGEKIVEELILSEEKKNLHLTHHNKIWVTHPSPQDYSTFDAHMDRLFTFSQHDPSRISQALQDMDLHYKPR